MVVNPVLHHVNFKTLRLQEMIDWYGLVVGVTVTYQYPGGAWLTNDEANHRIALLSVPGLEDDPEKVKHLGLHHTAYEVSSLAALLDKYLRLRQQSITPRVCVDHGMTTSFYYADPELNLVELQCDNFGDWSKSTEFMHSGSQFAADPIGATLDPDLVLEAHRAGVSAKEIHERGYAGEFAPTGPVDYLLPSAPRV